MLQKSFKNSLDRRDSGGVLVTGDAAHKALCCRHVVQPDHRVGCPHHQVVACGMEGHAADLISISDGSECLFHRRLAVVKQLNGKVTAARH